jgi:hypothetical protein
MSHDSIRHGIPIPLNQIQILAYLHCVGSEEADGNVYIVLRVLLTNGWRCSLDKVNVYAFNPSGGARDGLERDRGEALPVYTKFGRDPPGYLPTYESETV